MKHRMVRRVLAVGLAWVCGSSLASQAAAPVAAVPPASGPVIVRLAMRHESIVVRAGTDGPTYAMESPGGRVVVPPATEGRLAVTNPGLLRRVKDMQSAVTYAGVE